MNKLSVKEMFRYFLVNITVEPMIALLIIPSVFSRLANQDLNLQKACSINLKFSDKICQDLKDLNTTGLKNEESQVQKLVAEMTIWTTLLGLIPLVLVMFSGAWSDRKGKRKPFLLLPIVGEFFASVGLILCVYFSSLPMEVSGFVGAFFPAATGGWTVTFMAVFSYIGDITEEHMRTVRIGFVDLFCSGGVPIGTALSGVLLEWFGFYGVFSLAAVFYLSGFIYGLFCVKESCEIICLQNTKTKTTILSPQLSEFKNYEMFDKKSERKWDFWNFLKEFFNIDHVTDTLKVACKDKSKNRQKKILLLIVVLFVVTGPLYGT